MEEIVNKNYGYRPSGERPEERSSWEGQVNVIRRSPNVPELITFSGLKHIPKSVDWRQLGKVTGVKNQGDCGACWAFSAAGAIEGAHAIKTGELVEVSEQELVDCAIDYGCYGSTPENAFDYVKKHGIDTAQSYPYVDKENEECKSSESSSRVRISKYYLIPTGDEDTLTRAVAEMGPVAAGIVATQKFHLYSGGVFAPLYCARDPWSINHAVLVVGYGIDAQGKEYFIVKNFWGDAWGEQGYIRVVRNGKNTCGIATDACIPIVE